MEHLYRAQESVIAEGGISVCGDWEPSGYYRVEVHVKKYSIIKTTPKGVWIEYLFDRKFVNLEAKKKYACATIKEAYEQLYHRKRLHVKHLKTNLNNAQHALDIAKTWLAKDSHDTNVSQSP